MYLLHNTDISSLKSILKDGYLKSYSLLKKSEKTPKYSEGDGIYTENKFVYFSCVDNLSNKNINNSSITLYFNSKLLFNKSFYIANLHSSTPDELDEWWSKNDKGYRIKMYKRKYNRYNIKYNSVLKKLYNYSFSVLNGKYFQVFQQIAVLNKVKLDELVAIKFKKGIITDSIIKYITKYYPNIIIK